MLPCSTTLASQQTCHISALAGYGDVRPVTSAERAYTVVGMLIGASLYAYMVSCCCSMYAREASMALRAAGCKAKAIGCDTLNPYLELLQFGS